ncbi:hypothetical protein PV08_01097 [Exophiala spinifera]|uniref:Alpha/beta hydrolase fold-3 domain-containing protein n=1 Tax=Exophiala spinifera TaxID=91928 RepID=A0A0D2A707_9EURO|nr:uncharacterized protein PV08_01097 [Exophiala spinifera]KIW20522.1 hypothetical protein PV08_01097 [Exophiala spinifera]
MAVVGHMLSDAEKSTTSYQPLHPSVRPKLDPEYVAFHDKYIQFVEPDDVRPWHAIHTRRRRPFPPGTSQPVSVKEVRDVDLGDFPVRIFWPEGETPESGWPVLVWYHGGGWAIGGIENENDFCSRMCRDASCVVVTVGYRLCPEHPYPVPVEDALEALVWVHRQAASGALGIDTSRIAIGGTSAGGNLSAVTALKASLQQPKPIPLVLQLLLVPVIDNTATVDSTWSTRTHAPWLTPARMTWYRDMYLPNSKDALKWDASPNLAPAELLGKTPKTWIGIAEQDLLAPEAAAFADQLRTVGVDVDVEHYAGMTHTILAMNGK